MNVEVSPTVTDQCNLYVEDLYALIDSTKEVLPELRIVCAGHCLGRPYLIDFDIHTIWVAGHRIPVVPYVEAMFEALDVIREYHNITDEPVHSRRLQVVPEPRQSPETRHADRTPRWPWLNAGQTGRGLMHTVGSAN